MSEFLMVFLEVLFKLVLMIYVFCLFYDFFFIRPFKIKKELDVLDNQIDYFFKLNRPVINTKPGCSDSISQMYMDLCSKYCDLKKQKEEIEVFYETDRIKELEKQVSEKERCIAEIIKSKQQLQSDVIECNDICKRLSEDLAIAKKSIVDHVMQYDELMVQLENEKYDEIAEFEKEKSINTVVANSAKKVIYTGYATGEQTVP